MRRHANIYLFEAFGPYDGYKIEVINISKEYKHK
jgi:hypothetical protein